MSIPLTLPIPARPPLLLRAVQVVRSVPLRVVVLSLIVSASVAAPLVAPYDPVTQFDIIALKNAPPSATHLLGTDPFARDLLSRALHGGRVSLLIAAVSTLVATFIALAWGIVAGMARPAVGNGMMGLADCARAVPRKLLLLGMMLLVPRQSTFVLALLLGAGSWTSLAQVVYTETRVVRGRDFIGAASALGVTTWRTWTRHIAPHLAPVIGAASATLLADMLAVEAGLSFLGLGVRSPTPSWGAMLQDGVQYLGSAWWVAAVPCVLLVLTVVGVARLADGLTDMRHRAGD